MQLAASVCTHLQQAYSWLYIGGIACIPSTPPMVVMTVTTIFRIVFQASLLIFIMFNVLVINDFRIRGSRRSTGIALSILPALSRRCRSGRG